MKKKLFSIFTAHFVHDIYTSFLSPILPILIKNLSLNYSAAAFLTVCVRLPTVINPIIGLIADRSNLKYLVIITPFTTALFMSIIGIIPSFWLLAVVLFLAGLSAALFHVPAPVLVRHVTSKTGMGMSYYMAGGELARTLGPIIIMSSIALWGLEKTYYLLPLGLFTSIYLHFILKNINTVNKNKKHTRTRHSIYRLLQLYKVFIAVFGIMLSKSFCYSALRTFLPVYFVDQGHSLFVAGSTISIQAFAGVIGISIAGPLSDKIGKNKILITLSILSPITMYMFLITSSWIQYFFLILTSMSSLAATPVVLALIQEHGKKIPALANSVFMTMAFAVSAVVILITGKIADIIGLEQTFQLCAAIAVICLPLLFFLPKELKEKY